MAGEVIVVNINVVVKMQQAFQYFTTVCRRTL